jgi:hypothetical protein
LGLGVSVISDKIGPVHENTVSTDLSYTTCFGNFKLSFGIKATANLFDLDVSRLSPKQAGDLSLQNFNSLKYQTGLYLHSEKLVRRCVHT